ncbi:DNA ligase D [Sediminibacillus albus]|uniref:DNA ligase (ATP) n=1 Tax=Sediminibacillus albus TaxID=407036 RepID=A0A1G8ZNY9_9BACI|nr:DNA ligase D [Sediminibacillus albus]SDK16819.1 bifunctional non-homologous end joining protein LigD [Sediminibacillus albus]
MKLMQPLAHEEIPTGNGWVFETKYDGFRAVLHWREDKIELISRNGKTLSENFPEIIAYCKQQQGVVNSLLPLAIDGEIAILNTMYQANFPLVQQRGRFKSAGNINKAAESRPAHFLCFDLLLSGGTDLQKYKYDDRKQQLHHLFDLLHLNSPIDWQKRLAYVERFTDWKRLWKKISEQNGEGIIAKRSDSPYSEGKSHRDWLKIKNWRTISAFITAYDLQNGYFEIAVYQDGQQIPVGKFKHGLEGEQLAIVKRLITAKGNKEGNVYFLPPAICVDIHCLDVKDGELREPVFHRFRVDLKPEQCTWQQAKQSLAMLPQSIHLTNQQKVFWPEKQLTKGDMVIYFREIAPYMLPFLRGKALTVIRCPDGVAGESFFQKHLPAYAPDYLAGTKTKEETLLHCGTTEALIWLANHGALEYHVPFQYMGSAVPNEIVFDLDPPGIKEFKLAAFAAQLLKELLDKLELVSFVKTSGNKGIQVYIPIPEHSLTYAETASFTQAIALLLENQHGDLFTTQRLKKNRGGKLYIDYVQHGRDKTLIAPYSPRKTEQATVSTPLFWGEVAAQLSPEQFTIGTVVERVKEKGCPFAGYHQARDSQKLDLVKQFIAQSRS